MQRLAIFALLGLVLSVYAAPIIGPATAPFLEPSKESEIIPGSYVVVFKPEVSAAAATIFAQRMNATNIFRIGTFSGFGGSFSDDGLMKILSRVDLIQYVEYDQVFRASGQQSNPPSWGIDRIDQKSLPLDKLFKYPDSQGSGVRAYIVDTGILVSHNDFGGRAKFEFKAQSSWSDTDGNGHGTHVAGTTGGNSYGVAKKASLIAIKVLGDNGSGTTNGVVAGVNYVASNGSRNKDVANMSLGGGASTALDQAVAAGVTAGITFVVAAGNNNGNACSYSPAREPSAITVMATDSADRRATYSNYGTCCDIFAPGTSITSAWIGGNSATNTISGTSMASPHVCGVAALYQGLTSRTPAALTSYMISQATKNVITNPGTGSPNNFVFSPAATRPSSLLVPARNATVCLSCPLLIRTIGVEPVEVRGNNRSVMPFDVLGRTRATLTRSSSFVYS